MWGKFGKYNNEHVGLDDYIAVVLNRGTTDHNQKRSMVEIFNRFSHFLSDQIKGIAYSESFCFVVAFKVDDSVRIMRVDFPSTLWVNANPWGGREEYGKGLLALQPGKEEEKLGVKMLLYEGICFQARDNVSCFCGVGVKGEKEERECQNEPSHKAMWRYYLYSYS